MAKRGRVELIEPPRDLDPAVFDRGTVSVEEAAEMIGVGVRRVRRMMRSGEIAWGRLGGRTRIATKDAERVADAGWKDTARANF